MAETRKETAASDGVAPSTPGEVITPGGTPNTPQPTTPPAALAQPVEQPVAEAQPVVAQPEPSLSDDTVEPVPAPDSPSSAATNGGIAWTASEFVAHEKSAGWYLMLTIAALAIAGIIYLLTKDVISTIVVLVCALVLGIYAGRKPRQLEYRVDSGGVGVGPKYHNYEEFRSFAIVPEGAFASIVFMPLKRFAATTTIYYAPEDEDKIVALLADRLPLEEHGYDAVDRLMHRIRF